MSNNRFASTSNSQGDTLNRESALRTVVLVGSGGVATSLAHAIASLKQYKITTIYGHTLSSAAHLADSLRMNEEQRPQSTHHPEELPAGADLYLIAVKDDHIEEIARQLRPGSNSIVAHTGAVPSIRLLQSAQHRAILYPINTFSRDRVISLKGITFLTECSDSWTQASIHSLIQDLSASSFELTEERRLLYHLSAVFACNFSNHLYTIAHELMHKAQLPTELLTPLIQETAEKVKYLLPKQAQTGPAVRKDRHTIEQHRDALSSCPEAWKTLYDLFTQEIIQEHSSDSSKPISSFTPSEL